jgi:hypothetical protein
MDIWNFFVTVDFSFYRPDTLRNNDLGGPMTEESCKIQEIDDPQKGKFETLYLDLAEIGKEFGYAGLWYACDRSEKMYIVTELYYGEAGQPLPEKPAEEIPENNFKNFRRHALKLGGPGGLWMAAKTSPETYCKFKLFPVQQEKSYINYKLIKNRGDKFDVLGSGLIKGSQATFLKLGVEDGTGDVDFNDTIFYIVMVRELPPQDWGFDLTCLGVDKCPVMTPVQNFSEDRKYAKWLGQSPLDGRK